ncbi:MAG: hypothetical protein ACREK5_08035 [Gemmatimonadota bacterium]
MSALRVVFTLIGACLVLPVPASGQIAPDFGRSTVEVVSEWQGKDRGDGSGSYSLVTTLTDGSTRVSIRHELSAERDVQGELASNEFLIVLEGGDERYRAEGDPSALGPYAVHATSWAIPFDLEFHPDPRGSYRAREKRVAEVVRSVVPDAEVSVRGGSDGRTSATIEVPGEHAADLLARQFVGIREAFREADLGLAKLVIKGHATAPAATAVASPGSETP